MTREQKLEIEEAFKNILRTPIDFIIGNKYLDYIILSKDKFTIKVQHNNSKIETLNISKQTDIIKKHLMDEVQQQILLTPKKSEITERFINSIEIKNIPLLIPEDSTKEKYAKTLAFCAKYAIITISSTPKALDNFKNVYSHYTNSNEPDVTIKNSKLMDGVEIKISIPYFKKYKFSNDVHPRFYGSYDSKEGTRATISNNRFGMELIRLGMKTGDKPKDYDEIIARLPEDMRKSFIDELIELEPHLCVRYSSFK
jgi:hypothetical protein